MVTHMVAMGIVIGMNPWCVLVVTVAVFGLLSWQTLAIPAASYVCQVVLAILLTSAVRWGWVGIGLGVMALLTPIMVVILAIQILPQLGQM